MGLRLYQKACDLGGSTHSLIIQNQMYSHVFAPLLIQRERKGSRGRRNEEGAWREIIRNVRNHCDSSIMPFDHNYILCDGAFTGAKGRLFLSVQFLHTTLALFRGGSNSRYSSCTSTIVPWCNGLLKMELSFTTTPSPNKPITKCVVRMTALTNAASGLLLKGETVKGVLEIIRR